MTLFAYRKSLQRDGNGIRPRMLNVALLLVLVAIIGIPCVAPFGSEAGSAASSIHLHQKVSTAADVNSSFPSSTQLSLQTKTDSISTSTSTRKRFQLKNLNLWEALRSKHTLAIDQPQDWKEGELQAGLLSRLFYFYPEPLLDIASKRTLQVDDAFYTPQDRKMGTLVPTLENIYNRCRLKSRRRIEAYESSLERADTIGRFDLKRRMKDKVDRSKTLTLAKAVLIHQKHALIKTGILRLINTLIQAFPAILVSRLLRFIEQGEAHHPSKALYTALSLILLLSFKMIVENKYFYNVVKSATEIRGTLMGMIFDKSLRVSCFATMQEKGDKTTISTDNNKNVLTSGSGSVINLMQSDATVIENLALQVHTLWDGLLQISIYSTLLFIYLGRPVIYGILVLLLTIPLNTLTLRILNRMSKAELEAKDARSKKTTEAIQNMKLLKLQGWVSCFQKDIEMYRKVRVVISFTN